MSKNRNVKIITPQEFSQWLRCHGHSISSFAVMMGMHRRTLQRVLSKKEFPKPDSYYITLFCFAYDLGFRVDGMIQDRE